MGLPTEPVTFSPAEVHSLNQKLANMRHNVNNNLALMVAAIELMRRKPEMAPRLIENLAQQPDKMVEEIKIFTEAFERSFKIVREGDETTFGKRPDGTPFTQPKKI
ncbi:MAG: hypothetical protein SFY81_08960 [Verrucomicrobiota bacterium]|nr:hypothetical protein [Verrucomicrobiota bacterium]